MTRFEYNAKLCHINNNILVVERNVPSLVCEWCWIRLSPLQLWWHWLCIILLMGLVGLILLCSCLGFGFGLIKLKSIFSVSIRTTENYQFDKFRTTGVTGNAIINSQGQGDNPVCSTRDEISQPSRPFSPRTATSSNNMSLLRHNTVSLSLIFTKNYKDVLPVFTPG